MNTVLSKKRARLAFFSIPLSKLLLFLAVLFASLCFLTHPQTTKSAVSDALYFCFSILIPSLFPFAIAGEILVLSGFGSFFGLRSSAFLLGALCGFPIGGKTVLSYYESGYLEKGEAELLSAACNNAGAGFVIAGIGSAMCRDTALGGALYIAQLISAIIVFYALKPFLLHTSNAPRNSDFSKIADAEPSSSALLARAVPNAVTTMLKVCGFMVFFELLLSLIPIFTDNKAITVILSVLLEVTSGVTSLLPLSIEPATEVLSKMGLFFAVGFGGLSVYMQLNSFVGKKPLATYKYLIFKLLQGTICAVLGAVYCIINKMLRNGII